MVQLPVNAGLRHALRLPHELLSRVTHAAPGLQPADLTRMLTHDSAQLPDVTSVHSCPDVGDVARHCDLNAVGLQQPTCCLLHRLPALQGIVQHRGDTP